MSRQIWLTVARIPCPENIEANRESRTSRRCTEWCLNRNLFLKACKKIKCSPNIDLFASRINYQVKPFVSYREDPEALAINAFHLSWQNYKFYAFPPFGIINQVLQKMQQEKSEGMVLIPKWPTQTWWPMAMRMLIQVPLILPKKKQHYFSQATQRRCTHFRKAWSWYVLCHLSGNASRAEVFLQELQRSSKHLGEQVLGKNIQPTYNGAIHPSNNSRRHFE